MDKREIRDKSSFNQYMGGVLRCCACAGGMHNSKQLQLAGGYYIIAEIMGSKDSTG